MNLENIFHKPAMRNALECAEFQCAGHVYIADWDDLDAATCWCRNRWATARHGFRRILNCGQQIASFEFADVQDAVEFKLRYG